jgi:hypothetical protein
VPYMALVAALWEERAPDAPAGGAPWTLFAISVALNFIPGRHLSRVALFYSAHFLSSIFALAAIAAFQWSRENSLADAGPIAAGGAGPSRTAG